MSLSNATEATDRGHPPYAEAADVVLAGLGTSVDDGLTAAEAASRLASYGANHITGEKPPSVVAIALAQLQKRKYPSLGYDPLLVERMRAVLGPCRANGVTIVTNSGAANRLLRNDLGAGFTDVSSAPVSDAGAGRAGVWFIGWVILDRSIGLLMVDATAIVRASGKGWALESPARTKKTLRLRPPCGPSLPGEPPTTVIPGPREEVLPRR